MTALDVRAVRVVRDLVAAMDEVAAREAGGSLTEPELEAMRDADSRFRSAIEHGEIEAALRADDELHGVLVAVAANRALTAVLDQFTPVLRPAVGRCFYSQEGRVSLARHDGLIRLCAAGGAEEAGGDRLRRLPQPAGHPGVIGSLRRARLGSLCPRRKALGHDLALPLAVGNQPSPAGASRRDALLPWTTRSSD